MKCELVGCGGGLDVVWIIVWVEVVIGEVNFGDVFDVVKVWKQRWW